MNSPVRRSSFGECGRKEQIPGQPEGLQPAAQTLTLREDELLERKTLAEAELPASVRLHSSLSTLAGKPVQLIKKTN
jgi:hypothetical protein